MYILRLVGYVTVFFLFFFSWFNFYFILFKDIFCGFLHKIRLFRYWLYIYTSSADNFRKHVFIFNFFLVPSFSWIFLPPPQKMPWVTQGIFVFQAWKTIFHPSKNRILYLFYADFLSLKPSGCNYPFSFVLWNHCKNRKTKANFSFGRLVAGFPFLFFLFSVFH